MPSGPFGFPRLTTIGPFSQPTDNMNPAGEAVKAQAEKLDSGVDKFLLENGRGFSPPYTTRDGVKYSEGITEDQISVVEDAMEGEEFRMKLCFSNALSLWNANHDIKYVEGYGVIEEGFPIQQHAWNILDGELIDTTTTNFDFYWGHVIRDNSTLEKFYKQAKRTDSAPIVFDWKNGYEYLTNRGVDL